MYETFFDLQHRPFPSVPASDHYMPFEAVELARTTIERVIDRAEGPALLMAPAGMGKTLLCHLIANRFHDEFSVAILANSKLCSRRALLQNILFELNLPFRDMEEGELRLSLMDLLKPEKATDRGMLLIVDEAHTVPMPLLEELRLITNFVRNGEPRVRLLLAGSASLEERFAHPKMASFQQRVAARCYLHSLSRDEVREYIQGQLFRAGPGKVEFTEDAFHAVHTASDGIPRLVNQICDHTMLLASVGGVTTIDAAGVEEAWADLQQLPTPWTSDETQQSGEHFIEFGSLDDDPFGEPDEPTDVVVDDETDNLLTAEKTAETDSVDDDVVHSDPLADPLENTNAWSSDGWGTGLPSESDGELADTERDGVHQVDEQEFEAENEDEKPETDSDLTEIVAKRSRSDAPHLNAKPWNVASTGIVSGIEGCVVDTDWLTNFSCVVNTHVGSLDAVESLIQQAVEPVGDLGNVEEAEQGEQVEQVTETTDTRNTATPLESRVDMATESFTVEESAVAFSGKNDEEDIVIPEPDVIPLAGDPFGGDFREETLIYDPADEVAPAWQGAPTVSQLGVSQLGVSQLGVSQLGVSQIGVSQIGVSQERNDSPIQLDKNEMDTVVRRSISSEDKSLDSVDLPENESAPQPVAVPAPTLQIGFDLSDRIVLPFHTDATQRHDVEESFSSGDAESEESVSGVGVSGVGETNDQGFESVQPTEGLEIDLDVRGKAVAVDLTNTDDRDLLIIEENPTDIVVTAPTYEPMAERREYPQLFDTLRQEQ